MCTRFGNVVHVYMHTEVAYKYIYSGHAHTANGSMKLAMKSSSLATVPFWMPHLL